MSSSYLVLTFVTLIMMLEQGTIKSLGVFLLELQEQFITNTWVIGMAISFAPGFGSLECLLILPILRSGSVIEPSTLLIIAGVISGLGLILGSLSISIVDLVLALTMEGFLLVAKVISMGTLTTYYKENIELVTAIAMSGQSVGVMVMPPMTQIFVDTYGWRGAMLLLGSIVCHIILSGVIVRHEEKRYARGYFAIRPAVENDVTTVNIPLSKHCGTYVGSILNITLLKNVSFINVLIQATCSGWAFTSWMIYLIPHAEEKGIKPANAVFLATVGGMGNLIGKLFCPILRKIISNRTTILFASTVAGVSLGIDPLLISMTGMSIASTLFALLIGLEFIASLASINEVVAEKHIFDAYAWFYLLYGMSSMAAGFVTGLLFDVTGSYDVSFIVMGAVTTIPVLTLGIEQIWRTMLDRTST